MDSNSYAEILVSELGIKSKSKKEVYDLLCQDGKIYLPPIKDAHSKYLSQVICGEKKHLKCNDVKVVRVPHLKGLRTNEIIHNAKNWFAIEDYLPEYEYAKQPNREFICNLVNSLCEEDFTNYIADCLKKRVKCVVLKKRMSIKALPEFIKIFKQANSVSVSNGRSHYLLKRAGSRRWGQVKLDDAQLLRDEKEKVAKLNFEAQKMREELEYQDSIREELIHKNSVIEELKQRGLLDNDGMIP